MNRSNFAVQLKSWYQKNARDLPWRQTRDPYKIWISEIMLQQTTVNAVIPYYLRWIEQYPTIQDVAKAPQEKILKSWQGLGYYARAKNIHKSAQIIVRDFNGEFPRDIEVLKKLPGFGPYTLGAVLSIAFDQRVPIIDANVRRVMMRRLAMEGVADTTQDKEILAELLKVMPKRGNRIFNQALMELGALLCKNQQPACLICPTNKNCQGYVLGKQDVIPEAKVKKLKDIQVAVAVIKQDKKIFLQKRASKGLLADLWELPGGKLELGETSLQALKRELREELGCEVVRATHLFDLKHFYTQFRVKLHVFEVRVSGKLTTDRTHKWVSSKQRALYAMPSGTVRILKRLS